MFACFTLLLLLQLYLNLWRTQDMPKYFLQSQSDQFLRLRYQWPSIMMPFPLLDLWFKYNNL